MSLRSTIVPFVCARKRRKFWQQRNAVNQIAARVCQHHCWQGQHRKQCTICIAIGSQPDLDVMCSVHSTMYAL